MSRHLLLLTLMGCTAPAMDTFNQVEMVLAEGEAAAADEFVALADGASESLHVAIPGDEAGIVSAAVLDAWDRGLEVEVVTDYDRAADAGIASLIAAGVPVTLADAGIGYFDFNTNADVAWTSEQTIMSHAFAVADRERIVAANRIGADEGDTRVVFRMQGEEIVEDLLTEHNQVFGGADATATTAFDGMAKSIADYRWIYHTQSDQDLQLWFGPQERLTKRVIDAVYSARSTVYVMSDDLANEGLVDALQEKASWGFDVQVVVGAGFGTSSSLLSDLLVETAPDVAKVRVTDAEHLPTVVLIDLMPAADGRKYPAQALVLSHELYSAARLHRGVEVVNDQLIDGTLWVLEDYDDQARSPEIVALYDLFTDSFDRGGDL